MALSVVKVKGRYMRSVATADGVEAIPVAGVSGKFVRATGSYTVTEQLGPDEVPFTSAEDGRWYAWLWIDASGEISSPWTYYGVNGDTCDFSIAADTPTEVEFSILRALGTPTSPMPSETSLEIVLALFDSVTQACIDATADAVAAYNGLSGVTVIEEGTTDTSITLFTEPFSLANLTPITTASGFAGLRITEAP